MLRDLIFLLYRSRNLLISGSAKFGKLHVNATSQWQYFCTENFASLNIKDPNKLIHDKLPQSIHDHEDLTFF